MLNIHQSIPSHLAEIIQLKQKPNILIIDEDKNLIAVLSLVIRSEGYNIIHASDAEEAMKKIKDVKLDLVITEFMLKTKSSLELFTLIRKQHKGVPIFVVTAYSELISEKDIRVFGANEFFLKPLNIHRMRSAIRTYCD